MNMQETICDSKISPICIVPTWQAIEEALNSNLSTWQLIGKFGPEIIGILIWVWVIAGTKRGRHFAVRIWKLLDKAWDKMVVEPYNNEYPQYKKDANN